MARRIMLAMNDITVRVPPGPQTHICFGERIYTLVGDVGALDEPDPLQFGQSGKSCDRVISQMRAAAQVDIPDAIAMMDQALHSLVGDMPTVTKMDIVQILTQPRDGEDGGIRDIPALG